MVLPLRSFGRADLRRNREVAVQFVNQARDEGEVEAPGHGAERRTGRRDGVELRLVGGQRGNGNRAATHLHQLHIDTLLVKQTLVLGNKE